MAACTASSKWQPLIIHESHQCIKCESFSPNGAGWLKDLRQSISSVEVLHGLISIQISQCSIWCYLGRI